MFKWIIPVLQRRELKLREVKSLFPNCTAGESEGWDEDPGGLAPEVWGSHPSWVADQLCDLGQPQNLPETWSSVSLPFHVSFGENPTKPFMKRALHSGKTQTTANRDDSGACIKQAFWIGGQREGALAQI